MYSIQFTNVSLRIFKKLPKDTQGEIKRKAEILKTNPFLGKSLKGIFRKFRSLHFNHKGTAYRVIYQVFPKVNMLVIYLADKRENIYKRLEEMKL